MKPNHYFLSLNLLCGVALAAAWLLCPRGPINPAAIPSPSLAAPVSERVLQARGPIPGDTLLDQPEELFFADTHPFVPANPVTDWEEARGRALVRPLQTGEILRAEDLSRPVPAGKQPLTVPAIFDGGTLGNISKYQGSLDLLHVVPLADNPQLMVFLENVPLLHARPGNVGGLWHVMLAVTPEEAALIAKIRKPALDLGKAGEIVIALRRPDPLFLTLFLTPETEGTMLAHNVYFALKDPSPSAKQKLVQACKKYLSTHAGTVFFAAGTLAEELKREVNDRDFDVALHVIFQDLAAHDQYQAAPLHQQFIDENKANWKKVRVFDSFVER